MDHNWKDEPTTYNVVDEMEMVERGGRIVKWIAYIGIVMAVIAMFTTGNILSMIVTILISIGLLLGKNWVRILYIVLRCIGFFIAFITFMRVVAYISLLPGWFIPLVLITTGIEVTFVVLLTANKSVLAYFEYNKCTCQ